jgi:hypothetical protein
VGPEIPERGSQTSTVSVVEQILEIFRRDPNDFQSRLVTVSETWLYHYEQRAWKNIDVRGEFVE